MERKCHKYQNELKSFDFSRLLSILPSTNAVQIIRQKPQSNLGFYLCELEKDIDM
jgi:hypothetical protein